MRDGSLAGTDVRDNSLRTADVRNGDLDVRPGHRGGVVTDRVQLRRDDDGHRGNEFVVHVAFDEAEMPEEFCARFVTLGLLGTIE